MGAATTTRPVLPGVYPSYDAEHRAVVPPNAGAIVALPIVHNWGPVGVVQLCQSFAEFEQTYGTDVTPGRIAVHGAFKGEGLQGAGGAGAVLINRVGGASAAPATVALADTAAAAALTVDGKYPGDRGNRFSLQVLPITAGIQEVVLLDGTVEIESYSYAIADGTSSLADQLNTSQNLAVTVTADTVVGLATGTFALAGGDNGATLTGANWTGGYGVFEDYDFAFLAPFDLPWSNAVGAATIKATLDALVAWRDQQETEGHRFTVVIGGALDELPADSIARARGYANPGVITVGGPGFEDDDYGSLSTSQLAPRIAGIRAQRGEGQSMDMARLAGGVPRLLPTGTKVPLSDTVNMVQAGVIALQRDRWTVAPTRIAADVNTYQPNIGNLDPLQNPAGKPKAIWGNPKFVLSMQQFANDAQAEIEREMVGKVVVNDTTRNAAAARVLRLAQARERIGAFSPGTQVTAMPGSDTDTFVVVQVTITFGRALTQLFIRGTVR